MTDWKGRRPMDLVPLTDAWIKRQISTGGIVPPIGHVYRSDRVRRVTGAIMGIAVIALLGWAFMPVLWK